jgi:hypothetical protein
MPSINCRCGNVLHYGTIPCAIEWRFLSDVKLDSFSGIVDAEEVYRSTEGFLQCPACGRLWVFWKGFDSSPTVYQPEPIGGIKTDGGQT